MSNVTAPASVPESQASAEPSLGLGGPVLLEGEHRAEYDRLFARVTAAVRPKDVIEEFWVRDVVDLIWETLRLRRMKSHLLAASAVEGLKKVLEPMLHNYMARDKLAGGWYAGDEASARQVETILKDAGLTMDHVRAQALSAKLDD